MFIEVITFFFGGGGVETRSILSLQSDIDTSTVFEYQLHVPDMYCAISWTKYIAIYSETSEDNNWRIITFELVWEEKSNFKHLQLIEL